MIEVLSNGYRKMSKIHRALRVLGKPAKSAGLGGFNRMFSKTFHFMVFIILMNTLSVLGASRSRDSRRGRSKSRDRGSRSPSASGEYVSSLIKKIRSKWRKGTMVQYQLEGDNWQQVKITDVKPKTFTIVYGEDGIVKHINVKKYSPKLRDMHFTSCRRSPDDPRRDRTTSTSKHGHRSSREGERSPSSSPTRSTGSTKSSTSKTSRTTPSSRSSTTGTVTKKGDKLHTWRSEARASWTIGSKLMIKHKETRRSFKKYIGTDDGKLGKQKPGFSRSDLEEYGFHNYHYKSQVKSSARKDKFIEKWYVGTILEKKKRKGKADLITVRYTTQSGNHRTRTAPRNSRDFVPMPRSKTPSTKSHQNERRYTRRYWEAGTILEVLVNDKWCKGRITQVFKFKDVKGRRDYNKDTLTIQYSSRKPSKKFQRTSSHLRDRKQKLTFTKEATYAKQKDGSVNPGRLTRVTIKQPKI